MFPSLFSVIPRSGGPSTYFTGPVQEQSTGPPLAAAYGMGPDWTPIIPSFSLEYVDRFFENAEVVAVTAPFISAAPVVGKIVAIYGIVGVVWNTNRRAGLW